MSVEAMSLVFKHSPYTLAARLVHLAIADVVNDDNGWLFWGSQVGIAAKAKVSRTTVVATFSKMLGDGALVLVSEQKGATSVYRFVPPGVSDSEQGCAIDGRAPVQSTESHLLLTQEEQRANPLRGFPLFWQEYPTRGGRRLGRGKCEAIWRKMPRDERRASWLGAKNYAASLAVSKISAKDPERWLRDRCWEDWQDSDAAAESDAARAALNPHEVSGVLPFTNNPTLNV